LGAAAGGVPLDQEQLGTAAVLTRTVSQLARQRGSLGNALAFDLLARLEAPAGMIYGPFGDLLADVGMLVQPQTEGILDPAGDERGRLTGGQSLLGLTGKLRLGHLHRQHI